MKAIVKTAGNVHAATIADVPELAKMAAFGTLKRVHSASASPRMMELKRNLYFDVRFMENVVEWNNTLANLSRERDFYNDTIQKLTTKQQSAADNGNAAEVEAIAAELAPLMSYRDSLTARINGIEKELNYTVSDAADLYHTAVTDLMERITAGAVLMVDTSNGVKLMESEENTLYTRKTRKGETKSRNVFQMACVAVRAAIYANRGILEGSANYTYLEDMAQTDNNGNTEDALNVADRIYIRSGKWYDMPSIFDHDTQADFVKALQLKGKQEQVLHFRLQGFSQAEIAEKLGNSQQAISKIIKTIREKAEKVFGVEAINRVCLDIDNPPKKTTDYAAMMRNNGK